MLRVEFKRLLVEYVHVNAVYVLEASEIADLNYLCCYFVVYLESCTCMFCIYDLGVRDERRGVGFLP